MLLKPENTDIRHHHIQDIVPKASPQQHIPRDSALLPTYLQHPTYRPILRRPRIPRRRHRNGSTPENKAPYLRLPQTPIPIQHNKHNTQAMNTDKNNTISNIIDNIDDNTPCQSCTLRMLMYSILDQYEQNDTAISTK